MMHRKRPIARKDDQNNFKVKIRKPGMQITWKKNTDGEKVLHNHEFGLLFHYCTIGGGSRKPYWCALRNFKGSASSVVLRINCNDEIIDQAQKNFKFIKNFFSSGLQFRLLYADRDDFWKKMLNVADGNKEKIKRIIEENGDPLHYEVPKDQDDVNKLHFLVSLTDMAQNNYPIPSDGILPSKEKYKKVSKNSPIYCIDCEMCIVEGGGQAVTRFSMIDEDGNTVIDTLVKPEEYIVDYLTKYSGITEPMLKDVRITLKDCLDAIKYFLPDDAILLGHSLNCDLSALKLSHPYCIDIALLFNITGNNKKTSLRNLTKLFLKREIQTSLRGHCSVEDCKATLELYNLKATNGYSYGNVKHGFNIGMLPKDEVNRLKNEDDYEDDFIQTPLKYVPKIPPSKHCVFCGDKFSTECNTADCSCKVGNTNTCLKCMVTAAKKKREIDDDTNDKYFDWIGTTQKTDLFKSVSITNYMKKPMTTLLCGIRDPSTYISEENKFLKLIPATEYSDLDNFIKTVGPKCIEHKLSLLEHDIEKTLTDEEINQIENSIKHLFSKCVITNSLCSLVLASEKQTIAFIGIKDQI